MSTNWRRMGRRLAKAHGLKAIVLVAVGDDGAVIVAVHGEDRGRCAMAARWARGFCAAVWGGTETGRGG